MLSTTAQLYGLQACFSYSCFELHRSSYCRSSYDDGYLFVCGQVSMPNRPKVVILVMGRAHRATPTSAQRASAVFGATTRPTSRPLPRRVAVEERRRSLVDDVEYCCCCWWWRRCQPDIAPLSHSDCFSSASYASLMWQPTLSVGSHPLSPRPSPCT